MGIVHEAGNALQALVGGLAEEASASSKVIKRVRKFTASTLAQTFLFGFMQNPRASDEDLAQMAGTLGVHVTAQAVEQRYSPELVVFFRLLFEQAVKWRVESESSLAPILDRFEDVLLLDSTVISLPPELADQFPGCGGSHGGGQAAVKIQLQLSLKTGAIDAVSIESGRDNDMKTPLQQQPLPANTLRIADLGYFNTDVFQRYEQENTYWISRLLIGTKVYDVDGKELDLMRWLDSQGSLVDRQVLIGAKNQVACRILARRVPPEMAARRRQKLIEDYRAKGRTPSEARLAWCDYWIMVTNLPEDQLTANEARVLYASRWQVELQFKRWKSQGLVAELEGSTTERKMARMWARLLTVIVQHWLIVASVWGDPRSSLTKAFDAIRKFAILLSATIDSESRLQETIQKIIETLRRTARMNKRKRPSTFEMLNNPEKYGYSLT